MGLTSKRITIVPSKNVLKSRDIFREDDTTSTENSSSSESTTSSLDTFSTSSGESSIPSSSNSSSGFLSESSSESSADEQDESRVKKMADRIIGSGSVPPRMSEEFEPSQGLKKKIKEASSGAQAMEEAETETRKYAQGTRDDFCTLFEESKGPVLDHLIPPFTDEEKENLKELLDAHLNTVFQDVMRRGLLTVLGLYYHYKKHRDEEE